MAKAEIFRFHEDQYLEIDIFFGNPPREERIVFNPGRRLELSASVISQIFWEDPKSLRRLAENLRALGSIGTLNPARASLVADATQLTELFIKAGEVFPPED